MSYLLQYLRRSDSFAPLTRAVRVDEYTRLNRPGLYGDAYVRVFVEDTTARRRRQNREPRLELQIADCTNTINLEFSVASAELRENSLFKSASSRSRRFSIRASSAATLWRTCTYPSHCGRARTRSRRTSPLSRSS
jgi:hypothetical protein